VIGHAADDAQPPAADDGRIHSSLPGGINPMRLLRELSRRKLRTTLTILGITIGIWALVVFSSMANKINALVEGGSEYYANKILVTDGSAFGTAPMSLESANAIRDLDGVAAVDAQIQLLFDEEAGMSFGIPDLIIGAVPGADEGLEEFQLELATGRMLTPEDDGNVVVLGSTMATARGVAAGDTIEIRGRAFEVVGTLQPTLTAPDSTAIVPLSAAQEMFVESLPPLITDAVEPGELVNQVVVYPVAGADVDEVAARIEDTVANSATLTGAQFDEQVGASTAIFNAIIIGVAVISLVVGGLSVINTMAMSVAERTREIGIRRAIGGSRGRIIRALVAEAGLIGLIGGLIGLGLGALVVVLANEAGRAGGTVLFDLTAETALFAVGFSTILGMLAGVIPAWSAARLDPVAALRYE
jgi:putative ABC transport system permease protein